MIVVYNGATQETFQMLKVNFRCQKYVKKGYMGMTKKIYLEPQKSVLGRSIIHNFLKMFSKFENVSKCIYL